MRVTETLEHEHEVIRQVLQAGEMEVKYMEDNGEIRRENLEKMVDFFGNFVYRCHHAKEEDYLFPAVQQTGEDESSALISELLDEHETGHRHIQAMQEILPEAAKGNKKGVEKIKSELKAYVQLINEHINKENDCFFPAVENLLSVSEDHALEQGFERIESEKMGEGTHEKYHGIAEELSAA